MAQRVHTATNFEEKKKIPTRPLSLQRPATLPSYFCSLSLFTVRKGIPCSDSKPLGSITQLPSPNSASIVPQMTSATAASCAEFPSENHQLQCDCESLLSRTGTSSKSTSASDACCKPMAPIWGHDTSLLCHFQSSLDDLTFISHVLFTSGILFLSPLLAML